ncbi:hypothetical protein CPB85DRAFT_1255188 [Mucidula mucida]|nr:hypothetical protein CPB85DRAFT_1255188 [Mucidula mucida]
MSPPGQKRVTRADANAYRACLRKKFYRTRSITCAERLWELFKFPTLWSLRHDRAFSYDRRRTAVVDETFDPKTNLLNRYGTARTIVIDKYLVRPPRFPSHIRIPLCPTPKSWARAGSYARLLPWTDEEISTPRLRRIRTEGRISAELSNKIVPPRLRLQQGRISQEDKNWQVSENMWFLINSEGVWLGILLLKRSPKDEALQERQLSKE